MSAAAPDIASLFAGLGSGGAAPQDTDSGGGADNALQIIQQIVDLCQKFIQAEPDQEDKLQGAKLLQLAQQLLAKDQQDKDQALGGSNMRLMRKAG